MHRRIQDLIDGYDQALLTRDALVEQLAALVGSTPDEPPLPHRSTFRSIGLNHLALRVTDVSRSREFYVRHLGAQVMGEGPDHCFLACGANHFVALLRHNCPGLDHFCLTIDEYDPDRAAAGLEAAGFDAHRSEDRVFFEDPDGLVVQIADTWGDYPQHME